MTAPQAVNPAQLMFGDYANELDSTRRLLAALPDKDLGWKPHEKSLSLGGLAQHVANLPWWFEMTVHGDEFDVANFERQPEPASMQQVRELFEARATAALAALAELKPEDLGRPWTLRAGAQVYFTMPKAAVLRTFAVSHMIHHRAQLTVYLRLLGVPVPGLYGPSADEA